jgi:hypothetical protein
MVRRTVAACVVVVVAIWSTTGPGAAAAPALEVRGLHVSIDAGVNARLGGRVDVEITYRVVNTGSEAVRPTTRLRVSSQIGGGAMSRSSAIPTLAPRESHEVHEVVTGVLPFGSVTATVTVLAGDTTTTATTSTAVIPWFLLVALALVVAAAIAWTTRRRTVKTARTRARVRASSGSGP